MNGQSNTFNKKERLSGVKVISELFEKGSTGLVYPIKYVFFELELNSEFPVQAAFSVSKKIFKKAVDRNLLKRRMREAFRLNKNVFYQKQNEKSLAVMLIYIAKEKLPFSTIEKSIKQILSRLV